MFSQLEHVAQLEHNITVLQIQLATQLEHVAQGERVAPAKHVAQLADAAHLAHDPSDKDIDIMHSVPKINHSFSFVMCTLQVRFAAGQRALQTGAILVATGGVEGEYCPGICRLVSLRRSHLSRCYT